MKQHKWYTEIVAWASGAEIEIYMHDKWEVIDIPSWHQDNEYRIKPQPKEPQYLYVACGYATQTWDFSLNKDLIKCSPNHKYIGKIKLEVDDE